MEKVEHFVESIISNDCNSYTVEQVCLHLKGGRSYFCVVCCTQASVDPKSNFRLVSVTAHKKTSKVLYLCLYLLRQMVSCCILQKGSADHHEKKKYKLSKKKCVHTFCCIKYSINTESMYVGPCVSMRGNKYYIEGKRFSRQRDGETDTYRNTCTKV